MIFWPKPELPPINLWNVPSTNNGHVAQLVERNPEEVGVGGSKPSVFTKNAKI